MSLPKNRILLDGPFAKQFLDNTPVYLPVKNRFNSLGSYRIPILRIYSQQVVLGSINKPLASSPQYWTACSRNFHHRARMTVSLVCTIIALPSFSHVSHNREPTCIIPPIKRSVPFRCDQFSVGLQFTSFHKDTHNHDPTPHTPWRYNAHNSSTTWQMLTNDGSNWGS